MPDPSPSSSSSPPSPTADPLTDPFPGPFDQDAYVFGAPRSLVELHLIELSTAIRNKTEWRRKIGDASIRAKWVQEILQAAAAMTPSPSAADLAYLWAELDWLATQRQEASGIEPSTCDGVWQSDCLLPSQLLQRLQAEVRTLLEDGVEEQAKDWHPGSKEQVWDLVHPSLYCLIAGRSRVVDEDIPLQRCLDLQGAGDSITFAEFSRRAAAMSVSKPRNHLHGSFAHRAGLLPPAGAGGDAGGAVDDDSDAIPEQHTGSQWGISRMAEIEQALKDGKIVVSLTLNLDTKGLRLPAQHALMSFHGPPNGSGPATLPVYTSVYVLPTATVAELKLAVQQLPIWLPRWTAGELRMAHTAGVGQGKHHRLRDDRTLLFYDIHGDGERRILLGSMLTLAVSVRPKEQQRTEAVSSAVQAAPAPPARRCVQLCFLTIRRVLLCSLEADAFDTVASVKRRLHAGEGEGQHRQLPSTLSLADTHLIFDIGAHHLLPILGGTLLRDERRLSDYGCVNAPQPSQPNARRYNSHTVTLVWLGRAPAEGGDEWQQLTPLLQRRWKSVLHAVELTVDLLNPPFELPASTEGEEAEEGSFESAYDYQSTPALQRFLTRQLLVDVQLDDTVLQLKQRLSREHPRYTHYQPLPLSFIHLFATPQADTELDDAQTLRELGLQYGSHVGLRWEPTPQETQAEEQIKKHAEDKRTAKHKEAEEKRRKEVEKGKEEGAASTLSAASAAAAASVEKAAAADDVDDDDEDEDEGWVHPHPSTVPPPPAALLTGAAFAPRVLVLLGQDHRQQLTFYLPLTSTVRQLKEAIAKGTGEGSSKAKKKVLGVPVSEQVLKKDGVAMRDERPLEWYCAEDVRNYNDFAQLIWSRAEKKTQAKEPQRPARGDSAEEEGDTKEEEKKMDEDDASVEVQLLQVQEHPYAQQPLTPLRRMVAVPASCTVGQLKRAALCIGGQASLTEPPLTRTLSTPPPFLDDSLLLSACGVTDGGRVYVDISTVSFTVRILPGEARHTLRLIPRYTSVAQLKERIAALPDSIPVSHLQLRYFRSDDLSDSSLHSLLSQVGVDEQLSLLQLCDQLPATGMNQPHLIFAFRTDRPRPHPQDDWADEEWRRRHPDTPLRPDSGEEALLLTVQTDSNDLFSFVALSSEPLLSVRYRIGACIPRLSPQLMQLLLQPSSTSSTSSSSSSSSVSSQPHLLEGEDAPLSSFGLQAGGSYLLRALPPELLVMLDVPGEQLNSVIACRLSDSVGHMKLLVEKEMHRRQAKEARRAAAVQQAEAEGHAAPGHIGFHAAPMVNPFTLGPQMVGFGVRPPPIAGAAAHKPLPPPSYSRHLLHLRFPGARTAEVSDDTLLQELAIADPLSGQRSLTSVTTVAPTFTQPKPQQLGFVQLLLPQPGDRAISVQLQLRGDKTLHPLLLFRDEPMAPLRRFLFSKFQQHSLNIPGAHGFWRAEDLRLKVNGEAKEAADTVRDLHLTSGDVLHIEPAAQPDMRRGRHRRPQVQGGEGEEEDEENDEEGDEEGDGEDEEEGDEEGAGDDGGEQQLGRVEGFGDDVQGQFRQFMSSFPQPLVMGSSLNLFPPTLGGDAPVPPPFAPFSLPQGVPAGSGEANAGAAPLGPTASGAGKEEAATADPSAASTAASETKVEDVEDRSEVQYHTSTRYAWLPADFEVTTDGAVKARSYINNLHPVQHAALYSTVEEVLACFIPLFERVLTELRTPRPNRIPVGSWYDDEADSFEEWRERREEEAELKENARLNAPAEQKEEAKHSQADAEGEAGGEEKKAGDDESEEKDEEEEEVGDDEEGDSEGGDGEGGYEDEDEEFAQFEASRRIIQPEALPFTPPAPPANTVSLRGRTLQVIVKLCNIVLTPTSPRYEGGVWHVEGMRNELVVSSGIAYYDQLNISDSHLAFRTAITEPEYEQGDDRGVAAVYGLQNEGAAVQPAGVVRTSNGRCIAFPNLLQHQVQPFTLADPTQPGYRKILVFFLVDPSQRITSTLHVPPQQADWSRAQRAAAFDDALPVGVLQDCVAAFEGWPMQLAEAKKHRAGLMKERKFFVQQNTEELYERPFSLCEH